SWQLAQLVGTNTLTASSGAVSTTLTATGTPDLPFAITVPVGNNQNATVNTNVATAPGVLVKDRFQNIVVNGTPVTFAVATGGGSITGTTAMTVSGAATLGSWKLGTASGTNTVTVIAGAAPNTATGTITAIGKPDVPVTVAIKAGDGQSAKVNSNVATAPS